MEPRFFIWITLDVELFCIRSGFGTKTALGERLHRFLLDILEACKLSDADTPLKTDYRTVQIATYHEGRNNETKTFHVSESVAVTFAEFNHHLRKSVTDFADIKEAVGKNLLLQMLKSDVLGESLK